MKKLFFVFTLLISLSVLAQDGEMRINMWYGTIDNSDVEEHLASQISGIPEGLDAETWNIIREKHLSHFNKIYSTDVSYKGGFNNSTEGSKPADYAVINSMSVDWYKQADYESMELKTFMPLNKKNGMRAWGLTKVLDQLGVERKTNYYTVDFYNTLEEIYTQRSNTSKMSKSAIDANKKIDKIRTLLSSDIFRLVDYLD